MKKAFKLGVLLLMCVALLFVMSGCKAKSSKKKEQETVVTNQKKDKKDKKDKKKEEKTPEGEVPPEENPQTETPQEPTPETPGTPSAPTTPVAPSTPSAPVAPSAPASTRNLCAGFVSGVNTGDRWATYNAKWDTANKYVTASKSLEAPWNPGYGKAFLFDGVKCSTSTIFDHGAWVSCVLDPSVPVGENDGKIDETTVAWKKNDVREWLIVDLQGTFTVNKVNFSTLYKSTEHGMPTDFTIEVSTDKANWRNVKTVTGYQMDITTQDQSFTFADTAARYVRLNFTKASTKIDPNLAYCIALTELEIWGR